MFAVDHELQDGKRKVIFQGYHDDEDGYLFKDHVEVVKQPVFLGQVYSRK